MLAAFISDTTPFIMCLFNHYLIWKVPRKPTNCYLKNIIIYIYLNFNYYTQRCGKIRGLERTQ